MKKFEWLTREAWKLWSVRRQLRPSEAFLDDLDVWVINKNLGISEKIMLPSSKSPPSKIMSKDTSGMIHTLLTGLFVRGSAGGLVRWCLDTNWVLIGRPTFQSLQNLHTYLRAVKRRLLLKCLMLICLTWYLKWLSSASDFQICCQIIEFAL